MVVVLLTLLTEELNPDWFGYKVLFEDSGGWLSSQSRDPVFLWIIESAANVLGPDSYEAFRVGLFIYFAAFTFFLLRGRLLHCNLGSTSVVALMLGILPFVATRFTIQIREGLALTLAILGVSLLQSSGNVAALVRRRTSRRVWAAVILLVAYGIHAGTAFLLFALFASFWIDNKGPHAEARELDRLKRLRRILIPLGALAVYYLALGAASEVNEFYGSATEVESSVNLAKLAYWGVYGAGTFTMLRHFETLYRQGRLGAGVRSFFGVVAISLLPVAYLMIIAFLLLATPAILVSSAARVANMFLSMVLLLIALRGELTKRLAVFSVFILIDQVRIVYEALLGLYSDTAF